MYQALQNSEPDNGSRKGSGYLPVQTSIEDEKQLYEPSYSEVHNPRPDNARDSRGNGTKAPVVRNISTVNAAISKLAQQTRSEIGVGVAASSNRMDVSEGRDLRSAQMAEPLGLPKPPSSGLLITTTENAAQEQLGGNMRQDTSGSKRRSSGEETLEKELPLRQILGVHTAKTAANIKGGGGGGRED